MPPMIRSRRLRQRIVQAQNRITGFPTTQVLVERGMQLGERSYIGPKVAIDGNFCWLTSIGDDVIISPGARVLAHDASMKRTIGYTRVAPVSIGHRAYIGSDAIVCCGVTIGADAVIGAGSVVRKDVPPGTLVAGNPAQEWGRVETHAARHRERQAKGQMLGTKGWTVRGGIDDDHKRQMLEMARAGDVYVE